MTAKEFLRNKKSRVGLRSQTSPLGNEGLEVETMIEFAKYHVEQALKEGSEKAKSYVDSNGEWTSSNVDSFVSKDSILNSYPLENIK